MIHKLFRWIFREELKELHKKTERYDMLEKALLDVLGNIDVSVDVNIYPQRYEPSWAVISIQGQKTDFIRFVNLGDRDIYEIQKFLRNFDKVKVDCAPQMTPFLKIPRR